jgi:20S proteasome subunit beta 2
MTEEEAKQLCINAIEAGIYNDEGSGSNVDVCVMKKGKATVFRNIKSDNFKIYSKPGGYKFNPDRVEVLETYKHAIQVVDGGQPMELS